MKWAAAAFAVLFVVAAALQWNDPDPIFWVMGYLLAASLSAATAMGRGRWFPNALAAIGFGVWFLTLAGTLPSADSAAFRSFSMQAESHEEPREAVGLALCSGWCAILAWSAARGRRRDGDGSGGEAVS